MFSRRQAAFARSILIVVGGAAAIWFGGAAIVKALVAGDGRAAAAAAWLAIVKFASLAWVAGVGWAIAWRRLDEMQKETRMISWFIGSTAAILVTAPLMLFSYLSGGRFLADLLGPRGSPGAYAAVGWAALVFAQLLGSLIARAGWWAAKR